MGLKLPNFLSLDNLLHLLSYSRLLLFYFSFNIKSDIDLMVLMASKSFSASESPKRAKRLIKEKFPFLLFEVDTQAPFFKQMQIY